MQRSFRKLKREFENGFSRGYDEGVRCVQRHPARMAISPLFSLLFHPDDHIRWYAVTAAGAVIARQADTRMEPARVMMRRLMWNLNDESGGIGWGSPEVMGEALAGSQRLAAEFGHILFSYLLPDGNYLEHPLLQRGVLWGAGRAVHAAVRCAQEVPPAAALFLASPDACHRGLAAWFLAAVPCRHAVDRLARLRGDQEPFPLFIDGLLVQRSVAEMAALALAGAGE
jgi:hypothetical protein